MAAMGDVVCVTSAMSLFINVGAGGVGTGDDFQLRLT